VIIASGFALSVASVYAGATVLCAMFGSPSGPGAQECREHPGHTTSQTSSPIRQIVRRKGHVPNRLPGRGVQHISTASVVDHDPVGASAIKPISRRTPMCRQEADVG
jgi:hypothetical protein